MLAGQSMSASAMAQLAEGDEGEGLFDDDFHRNDNSGDFQEAMETMAAKVNSFRMWTMTLSLLLAGAIIVIIVLLTKG